MLNISDKEYRPLAEKAVKSYARQLFADYFYEEQIEDITSEVVYSMWRSRAKYDECLGAVTTWVGKIARNAVLDAYNKEKRSRSLFSSAPLVERYDENGDVANYVPAAPDQADDWLIAKDTERCLRNSVSTERDGRLLDGLIDGNSREDLAAAEGVKTQVVYTAVHHLRKRLRSVI